MCQPILNISSTWQQSATFLIDCRVPHGSVLGPLDSISLTEDIVFLFEKYKTFCKLYMDNTQDILISHLPEVCVSCSCLSACIKECNSHRLQLGLDAAKTEIIWFGFYASMHGLANQVALSSKVVQPVHVVHVLGVLLDYELNMWQHIAQV
jgi:hypothetical protein